jgi:hypothetical protein
MSRTPIPLLIAIAVLFGVVAVARLVAQPPVAQADVPELPDGTVTVSTATSPEPINLRGLRLRTVGGRPFLVGLPAERRQLTTTPGYVWIPVDAVAQLVESEVSR